MLGLVDWWIDLVDLLCLGFSVFDDMCTFCASHQDASTACEVSTLRAHGVAQAYGTGHLSLARTR